MELGRRSLDSFGRNYTSSNIDIKVKHMKTIKTDTNDNDSLTDDKIKGTGGVKPDV